MIDEPVVIRVRRDVRPLVALYVRFESSASIGRWTRVRYSQISDMAAVTLVAMCQKQPCTAANDVHGVYSLRSEIRGGIRETLPHSLRSMRATPLDCVIEVRRRQRAVKSHHPERPGARAQLRALFRALTPARGPCSGLLAQLGEQCGQALWRARHLAPACASRPCSGLLAHLRK
jgi:hypothetical protein